MRDTIEFYHGDKRMPFLTIESSFQPNEGDFVNIEKVTYKVIGRSFTVDHAETPQLRQVRCNVIVEKHVE